MKNVTSPDIVLSKLSTLSEEQVRSILESKNDKGKSLKESFDQQKPSSPEESLSLLCQHLNIPFEENINVNNIPQHLVQDIPIHYAKKYLVLPYKETENEIFVLTSNPLDFETTSDLKLKFQKKITPIVSTTQKNSSCY